MKVYTYSQARQRLAEVLDTARHEEVRIKRRGGDSFSVRVSRDRSSPFDVPAVRSRATTGDILAAIQDSRKR